MSDENNQMSAPAKKDVSALYIPISIVVAGIMIGGGLFLGLGGNAGSADGGGDKETAVNIKDVKIDGSPYIGKTNAPVVLAYWSDYQCPYCKAVEVGGIPQIPVEPAIPALIKAYVDTGKLKIVFKDYQFLSEDSTTAGLYGRAIWALYPGKYWEWREAMYRAQDEEHGGFGDEKSIVALTAKINGIDAQRVKENVASKTSTYQAMLDADREEGTAFGINGTPGFITGKILIPGAAEFERFKEAIDAQLK